MPWESDFKDDDDDDELRCQLLGSANSDVIPGHPSSLRSSQVSNTARTLRIINSQNEVKMIPKDACVFEVGLSQPVQPPCNPHHGLMAVRVGRHFYRVAEAKLCKLNG